MQYIENKIYTASITVYKKKSASGVSIIQDTLQLLSVHHLRHVRHLLWNMNELFEVTSEFADRDVAR